MSEGPEEHYEFYEAGIASLTAFLGIKVNQTNMWLEKEGFFNCNGGDMVTKNALEISIEALYMWIRARYVIYSIHYDDRFPDGLNEIHDLCVEYEDSDPDSAQIDNPIINKLRNLCKRYVEDESICVDTGDNFKEYLPWH
ncbi:MAG: hypothetical protein HRU15_04485 [Planctomycetes bacterium]|nr:hypothetical protein [Planctomycetota bacterium]